MTTKNHDVWGSASTLSWGSSAIPIVFPPVTLDGRATSTEATAPTCSRTHRPMRRRKEAGSSARDRARHHSADRPHRCQQSTRLELAAARRARVQHRKGNLFNHELRFACSPESPRASTRRSTSIGSLAVKLGCSILTTAIRSGPQAARFARRCPPLLLPSLSLHAVLRDHDAAARPEAESEFRMINQFLTLQAGYTHTSERHTEVVTYFLLAPASQPCEHLEVAAALDGTIEVEARQAVHGHVECLHRRARVIEPSSARANEERSRICVTRKRRAIT